MHPACFNKTALQLKTIKINTAGNQPACIIPAIPDYRVFTGSLKIAGEQGHQSLAESVKDGQRYFLRFRQGIDDGGRRIQNDIIKNLLF
jgi:hypothetical protein